MDTGFIQKINAIYEKLGAIDTANNSFNKEVLDVLVELKDLDLELIAQDIDKGTFLGNRKIDINLALNIQGITQELLRDNPDEAETIWTDSTKTVMYDSCIALFKDGVEITIPFEFDGNPTNISTHSDLLLQLDNNTEFKAKLENTSVSAFPSIVVGELLRFYDISGQSSNLERITLNAVTGAYREQNPNYFWAKSTSSVETLSMRGGDIIKLGNEIDNILALVNKISEVTELQAKLPQLVGNTGETTIFNKLTELQSIYDKLSILIDVQENEANITEVATNKANIDKVASQELTLQEVINNLAAIQSASANADVAEDSKNLALQYVEQLTGLTVNVMTLASGQSATQSYNSATNTLTLGIPQGLKGDRGEAFNIDARGDLANRTAYDGASTGFSYLSTDTNPTYVYFKKSDAVGDWTDGIAFGKGDKGERGYGISDISKTSTVGNIDTYTITIENGTTYTFTITNSDVSSVNGKTGIVVLTKADVGLSNVDNTSDANKPISIAQQEEFDKKADKENAYTKTEIDTELGKKQDTLESGTNVKTINGESILGSGDLEIKLNSESFTKPDNSKPLFVKANPHSITIPAGFKVKIGDSFVEKLADTTISLNTDLVVPETKTAGTDYYVYAKIDGSFYFSANDSLDTHKLIGGFHYGLVAENEAPTGNKTEAMMVEQRGIWEHSCWDLKFRPKAKKPEAMNYTSSGKWVDIYLMHEDYAIDKHSKANVKIAGGATDFGRGIPKIPLEFGGDGSVTYGKFTHFQAREIAACAGKELIPNTDFANYAYGVVEGTDSSTVGETVVGKTEHYPALTSRYMEQATGTQWIWGADIGNASGTAWENNTDSRGQTYGSPKAVLFGGHRGNGSRCGSRCSFWNNVVSNSSWDVGCRFACDHLQLD